MKTKKTKHLRCVATKKYVKGILFPKFVERKEMATNFQYLFAVRSLTQLICTLWYRSKFEFADTISISGKTGLFF
jgi:hypothetical protein